MPTVIPGRQFSSTLGAPPPVNTTPMPTGGIAANPNDPNWQAYRGTVNTRNRQAAEDALIPGQAAEQQGVANLEQLAEKFGLSADVSPSSSLASATGVYGTAPPPQPSGSPIPAWSPGMPGGGSFAPPVAPVAMPADTTAGTFARAKDRAAGNLTATLKAIRDNANARGMAGSTAEQAATNTAVLGAGQTLADVSTQTAADYAKEQEEAAKVGYEGSVTQRGQDISALEASRGQDLTARGQDIGARESANALAEREWEAQQANARDAARLAMEQRTGKFSQLSALGSLLARVTPRGAPAEGVY